MGLEQFPCEENSQHLGLFSFHKRKGREDMTEVCKVMVANVDGDYSTPPNTVTWS